MDRIARWRDDSPWVVLLVVVWLGAMARGQAIYWLGRGLVGQARARTAQHPGRLHAWLTSPAIARAERWLDRFGWPLVPLAYLTVGVQSAVMAAAGILRMRWALFTVAQVPGAVAWALIYTTIGFAAWEALIGQAVGSWLGWLVLALAVLIGGSWLVTRRLRRAQAEK